MENNPDIAKGFVRGDKVKLEEKWREVTITLNGAGPPSKDVNGWKRTWTDWKCDVRKKLSHNKKEDRATGGGAFSKYTLNEESLARISGIYMAVDGIPNCHSFGVPSNQINDDPSMSQSVIDVQAPNECDNATPNISRRATPSFDKTKRKPNFQESVKSMMKSHNKSIIKIESHLSKIEKNHSDNSRRIRKSLESIDANMRDIKKLFKKHHEVIEKTMVEKNEIKKRMLEIEQMKFEIPKNL